MLPSSRVPVPNAPASEKFTVPAVTVNPAPIAFAALRFTVPPAAFTTTLSADSRLFTEPLNVKVPPPVRVRVLELVEVAVFKFTVLLKTNAPPAACVQVLLPLALFTTKLNVCVAVELLVSPFLVCNRLEYGVPKV